MVSPSGFCDYLFILDKYRLLPAILNEQLSIFPG